MVSGSSPPPLALFPAPVSFLCGSLPLGPLTPRCAPCPIQSLAARPDRSPLFARLRRALCRLTMSEIPWVDLNVCNIPVVVRVVRVYVGAVVSIRRLVLTRRL